MIVATSGFTGVVVTIVLAIGILWGVFGGIARKCPYGGKQRRSGHTTCHHCGRG
jgi:hypothetical protein